MAPIWLALAVSLVILSACGEPQGGAPDAAPASGTEIPSTLRIVCHEDGSTELIDEEVRTSHDGVHFRMDNRAGETVSLNGAGLDFGEGVTEQAARSAPGELEVACWPGSMHDGPEPEPVAIRIHDPAGLWTPGELECPPEDRSAIGGILDYLADSAGTPGEPEQIAREQLKGIDSRDRIMTVGYPEAEFRDVAVIRDGVIVAVLSYSPAAGGGWLLGSYTACASAGIAP